jgi:cyanophycin synthetase
MQAVNSCPDCGPNVPNHLTKKWFIVFDWVATPFLRMFEGMGRISTSLFGIKSTDGLASAFTKLLLNLGAFQKISEISPNDTWRTKVTWEEAKRRGIEMHKLKFFGLPTAIFTAAHKGKTIVFESLPRPEGDFEALKWMDNKAIMREKFKALGIPVARGGVAFTFKKAMQIFHEIGAPVIVKPHLGSRSQHTSINIANVAELERAFKKAKQLSPLVVVEKELSGFVHRATMIGGKFFASIRREQPHVVGDGVSTIAELIEKENQNPKRDGTYFYPLPRDAAAEAEIARQGYAWHSIPDSGKIVLLNQKAVGYLGSGLTDVTDVTHPENIKLFEKIDAVLGVPVHGIDFITSDISKPWQEVPDCGIIECNSLPFLEMHHFPLVGTPRNATGALWELVFPG